MALPAERFEAERSVDERNGKLEDQVARLSQRTEVIDAKLDGMKELVIETRQDVRELRGDFKTLLGDGVSACVLILAVFAAGYVQLAERSDRMMERSDDIHRDLLERMDRVHADLLARADRVHADLLARTDRVHPELTQRFDLVNEKLSALQVAVEWQDRADSAPQAPRPSR